MGVVYEAEDPLLKRRVAIKLLPREVSANPEALKRFQREGQGAARLNHPNVVALYDIGEADGTHFMVMELMGGGSAQDFLRKGKRFQWREATSIIVDVCRGAEAAHRAGLIHRDIKPANILRTADGVVKLGDFGLVKSVRRKGTVVTALGDVIGTPHFMSPEQCRSSSVDERSDIYSLGATYFALLTGHPPYEAEDAAQVLFAHCSYPIPDPRASVWDIPEDCSRIIRKAMAKNRAERYANVASLLADLEPVLMLPPSARVAEGVSVSAPSFEWNTAKVGQATDALSFAQSYPAERSAMSSVLKRWKLVGLGLLSCVLLVILLKVLFFGNGAEQPTPQPALAVGDDWASVAEKAIRPRRPADMRTALDRVQQEQRKMAGAGPGQVDEMRQAALRLQKALNFRESITEKGLVVGVDGWVSSLLFSQDDRTLVVGQSSGGAGVLVFDGHTGEKLHTLWPSSPKKWAKIQSVSLAHDNSVLAVACAEETEVKLWRFADAKEQKLAVGPGVKQVLSVSFAPSKRNLVAGLEPFVEGRGRPYLKIWNLDNGLEPFPFKAEHSGRIWSVAFTAGGQQVVTGSQDKRVILWNADTGRIWRELRTNLSIRALATDPQGRSLVVCGLDAKDSILQFWDYAGERLLAAKRSPFGECRCVAYERRGGIIASSSGKAVLLWNAETQELLATFQGHGQSVTALAFSNEGGILATGSEDQTVRLWDVSRFLSLDSAS